ncbi:PKD domain-containing protein [Micromonospora sp. 15K316]|uniref:PKD domain-containing protein n=1 Tax=Micromonospora sp. 15K316 TaxID=2530376 RepID=UPI001404F602|nr:PKD domain-containing protein [Micromonospora sp. 15K316]
MLAALAATVGFILPGAPAQAQEPEPEKTYKLVPYVISDPELVKDPERIRQEFAENLNLDRLGIQPATSDGPSASTMSRALAADPVSYVVDSSRFPGGAKPADIYDYATEEQCREHRDQATQDAGWIKNRFSYCQEHVVFIPAVACVIPPYISCEVEGEYISVNTLRGQGKVGGHLNDPAKLRWADFLLDVDVTVATGPFAQPTAKMKASIECDGGYRNPTIPVEEEYACFPGPNKSTEKPVPQWAIDDDAYFELLSDARAPDAANGEQIAVGEFHIEYDFSIPWHFQFMDTESPKGGLRFDSAWYLSRASTDKLGSVFDRAVPGMSMDKADQGIMGAAVHIEEARANPAATVPIKAGKVLHGATPGDPLHRLPRAKSADHRARADRNRTVSTNYCATVAMPAQPTTGGPFDCDEYALASTYEGSARWEFEQAPQYELDHSVRWVNRSQNQEAGRRTGRWYANDRLLDQDPFFITIVDGADGGGGGGGGGGGDVDNPPTVSAGPDRVGNEGVPVILHGVASDDNGAPGVGWSYTAGPDVDAGAACTFADAHAGITTITCTDDGTFTVSLTANDGVNAAVSDSATVTLHNVAPAIGGTVLTNPGTSAATAETTDEGTVTPDSWAVFRAGDPVTLRVPFADPGTNDTHTCTVAWDDGTNESVTGQNHACERTHAFAHAGMYTIAATVTDDDGGTDQAETMVVVYDPEGGFATEGGILESPAGALTSDPQQTGKLHVQFNVKYQPGETGPVPGGGKVSARLDGSDFSLDSTSLEWLVVTPNGRVAVKGSGNVNGDAGYGFVAYGDDGQDSIRLVVWPLSSGQIPGTAKTYDNRPSIEYDLDRFDPQGLEAGSVIVHS